MFTRAVQDRRTVSRIKAHIACRFTFNGKNYDAYIRDISLKGAFVWSNFEPPVHAGISIKIETSFSPRTLVLESSVVRRDCRHTERGATGAFAVTFNNRPLDLIVLINKLAASKL